MKEASGELNLTVVTVVAIAAVLGFFVAFWPTIKGKITSTWTQQEQDGGNIHVNPNIPYIVLK